jgi:hypothetical protein
MRKPSSLKARALALSLACGVAPAAFALSTQPSHACACCSAQGQRTVSNDAISDYQRSILRRLRFDKTAHLTLGEAEDVDSVTAFTSPEGSYALEARLDDKGWLFSFSSEKGPAGTLLLPLPETMNVFEVDPREAPSGDEGQVMLGPTLYKEWTLSAKPTGTGNFSASSTQGWRMSLILHGRGNSCAEADHFSHWTITLHNDAGGRKTAMRYGFFGDLKRAAE